MKLDFLFLITTYNRYDLLVSVIERLEPQVKHLNYKIAIVDDCSNDDRYSTLITKFDNIIYHRNNKNNGRNNYYLTVNELFKISRNNESKYYVFLGDDILPSINFINHIYSFLNTGVKIINQLINQKETYTNWGLTNWVDGCFTITHDAYSKINYDFVESEIRKKFTETNYGTGVYKAFSFRFKKYNLKVHYPKHSLVYHIGHTNSVMHQQKRKIEPIHSYSFIDDCDNCDIFRDEIKNFLNKKIQLKISNSVIFFKDKLMKKYNLTEYTSKNEPTVFFGMYDDYDYKAFCEHIGEKVIIWAGTDALKLVNKKNWHNNLQNSNNIAISSFINKTLNSINVKNRIKPITPTENLINIKPKGDFIYWYYNSEEKKNFYGGEIIDQIEKLTKYKIIKANGNSFNDEELKNVYEKCFLGLRLTEHDGLSNTVVELGLMGRYCIHNGDTPNSLKYDKNDINYIIKLIDYEYSKINIINEELANSMYYYLNDNNNLHNLFMSFDITDNINQSTNNKSQIKKKSSEGTSNGDAQTPTIEATKKEPQSKPINNSQINSRPKKLHKPEKQNTISRIPNDIALGKLRKSNLRFGKR